MTDLLKAQCARFVFNSQCHGQSHRQICFCMIPEQTNLLLVSKQINPTLQSSTLNFKLWQSYKCFGFDRNKITEKREDVESKMAEVPSARVFPSGFQPRPVWKRQRGAVAAGPAARFGVPPRQGGHQHWPAGRGPRGPRQPEGYGLAGAPVGHQGQRKRPGGQQDVGCVSAQACVSLCVAVRLVCAFSPPHPNARWRTVQPTFSLCCTDPEVSSSCFHASFSFCLCRSTPQTIWNGFLRWGWCIISTSLSLLPPWA